MRTYLFLCRLKILAETNYMLMCLSLQQPQLTLCFWPRSAVRALPFRIKNRSSSTQLRSTLEVTTIPSLEPTQLYLMVTISKYTELKQFLKWVLPVDTSNILYSKSTTRKHSSRMPTARLLIVRHSIPCILGGLHPK